MQMLQCRREQIFYSYFHAFFAQLPPTVCHKPDLLLGSVGTIPRIHLRDLSPRLSLMLSQFLWTQSWRRRPVNIGTYTRVASTCTFFSTVLAPTCSEKTVVYNNRDHLSPINYIHILKRCQILGTISSACWC